MNNKEEIKMENLENNALTPEEMEKAAGGDYADTALSKCWTSCSGTTFMETWDHGVHYKAWRCEDCGHEYYEKNGTRISPSEFYKVMYGNRIRYEV